MTIEQLNSAKIGDTFFVVINTGITGISKYQYIGVFTCHATKEKNHVFLSRYFVSTVLVNYENPKRSHYIDKIFITKDDAEDKKNEMIESCQEH